MVQEEVIIRPAEAVLNGFNQLKLLQLPQVFANYPFTDTQFSRQGFLPGKTVAILAGVLREPAIKQLGTIADLLAPQQPVGDHGPDELTPRIDPALGRRCLTTIPFGCSASDGI